MLALLALLAASRLPVTPSTGVMLLPAGTIEVSAEIRLPPGAQDLEIRGDPAGTVLRMSDRFQGRALWICEGCRGVTFRNFTVDGNREALEQRTGLPPSNLPFAEFTRNNGILADQAETLQISDVTFPPHRRLRRPGEPFARRNHRTRARGRERIAQPERPQ